MERAGGTEDSSGGVDGDREGVAGGDVVVEDGTAVDGGPPRPAEPELKDGVGRARGNVGDGLLVKVPVGRLDEEGVV